MSYPSLLRVSTSLTSFKIILLALSHIMPEIMRLEINARRNSSFSVALMPELRAVRRRVDSPLSPRTLRVHSRKIDLPSRIPPRKILLSAPPPQHPPCVLPRQILRSGKRKIIVCLPHARAVIYRWQHIVDDDSQLSRCKCNVAPTEAKTIPRVLSSRVPEEKSDSNISYVFVCSSSLKRDNFFSYRCFVAAADVSALSNVTEDSPKNADTV